MSDSNAIYMRRAIKLAKEGMEKGAGGPFGCVVVRDDKIVGEAFNQVLLNNDPTAHAEMSAIREACRNLGTFQLDGCIIYTSCEPCPMCLGAIYWARPEKVYYAATREDAALAGFDDAFIYEELALNPDNRKIWSTSLLRGEAIDNFKQWQKTENKKRY